MVYVRSDQPSPNHDATPSQRHLDSPHMKNNPRNDTSRLNLLLSYGGWREDDVVDQLPRLLEPQGITSIRVHSGEEATDIIRITPIHIAVVDFAIPLHSSSEKGNEPGGSRILQLLSRLEEPPPTIVVRPPQSVSRESARTLAEALREGAFAVLDRPLRLETLLEALRRALRRHYADLWPEGGPWRADDHPLSSHN